MRIYEKLKLWMMQHPELVFAIFWLGLGVVLLGVAAVCESDATAAFTCVCR